MLQIKQATKQDYKTLCSLRRALLKHQNILNSAKSKSSDNLVKTYLERDYSIFYIAFVDKKPVGFIHGTIDPKPQKHIQAYVQDFFIQQPHRNKGIGTALLTKLHNHFHKNKVKPGLTAEDNSPAMQFYLKKGYITYKKEGKTAYLIQK